MVQSVHRVDGKLDGLRTSLLRIQRRLIGPLGEAKSGAATRMISAGSHVPHCKLLISLGSQHYFDHFTTVANCSTLPLLNELPFSFDQLTGFGRLN